MSSPTQRSLELFRDDGYTAEVVEKFNRFSNTRKDLFNVIDIVAIGNGEVLGVQATSASNVSARITKAKAEPMLRTWLESGAKFEVIGWSKKGAKGKRKLWQPSRRTITLADLN